MNVKEEKQQNYRLWHNLHFQHVILTLEDKSLLFLVGHYTIMIKQLFQKEVFIEILQDVP